MSTLRYALLLAAVMADMALADAGGLPTAPPNIQAAQAQGLQRLTAEELKALLPGTAHVRGPTGAGIRTINADGTFSRTQMKRDLQGTWRLDEKNSAYCLAARAGKRYEDNCFAVFRAPDGTHYFDYDIQDGFYARTWRRSPGQ